jgi:signal transduction histidine kinase
MLRSRLPAGPPPGTLPVSLHEGRTLGITTEIPASPAPRELAPAQRSTAQQPPDDITRGLFSSGRRMVRTHPLATDALLAAVLLALSTEWLAGSGFASLRSVLIQTVLIAAVVVRRIWPASVFLFTSALAFGQWLLGFPLLGDAAVLVALYTVAAHQSRIRALLAAALAESGAVMAALKWDPAGTPQRSLVFLTATVVAALFAGLAAASGRQYLDWMDERARRLEVERDQQAEIAAAAERTRIARELHDIVSHSLSVVITLADAAAIVGRADPDRGVEAMTEVSEVGRRALADMRAMLGVLRTDEPSSALAPQPGVAELGALADQVRGTGLAVGLTVEGTAYPLGAAAELTVYRIVQEALTNTLRHAGARHAQVTISYAEPDVQVRVTDDGASPRDGGGAPRDGGLAHAGTEPGTPGRGLDGMRERVALHGGVLRAGPGPATAGGWLVEASFRVEQVPA